MAKQWNRIMQHNVYGIVYAQRHEGYHITAQVQLYTDVAYTDAEILAMLDAETPQAVQQGATALDRWFSGFAGCYGKIREPNANDPMPRLGGIVEPEPLDVLDTLADERLVAFSRQYWQQEAH